MVQEQHYHEQRERLIIELVKTILNYNASIPFDIDGNEYGRSGSECSICDHLC